MAQFFTDFSEYTTGVAPSDWTERFATASSIWTVQAAITGASGKVLRQQISTQEPRLLSWDEVGTPQDVEIVVRCQFSSTDASWTLYRNRLFVRASGTSSTGASYNLVRTTRTNFSSEHNRFLQRQGSGTTFFNVSIDNVGNSTLTHGSWFWMRLRVNGTALKVKTWLDSANEPAAWDIETTDSNISAGGWVGVGSRGDNGTTFFYYDVVGVGTGGDTAPTEAPAAIPEGVFAVSDSITVGWTGLAPATTPEGVFAVSDSTSAGFVGARTSAATFDVSDTTNVTWTGQSPAIPATFPVADNTDVTWVGTRTSVPGTFAVADDVTVAWTGLLPPIAASTNRLQNPSFETLLPAWGSGKHDIGSGGSGTFSRTDVPSAFSGDFVGQYDIDGLTTAYELYVERIPRASTPSRGVYIPAEERGEQLTFSFYHRRSDGGGQTPQARLDIFFYDSGVTQISSQTTAAEWDLTQTSWSRSSLPAVSIPATAHYFGFRMYFRMFSYHGNYPAFTMLLDAFQVEFGATATPYQDTPVPTGTFATDVTDVVAWTGLSPAFSEYAVTDTVGVTWSGYRASAGTYEIDDIVTVLWFGQGPDVDRAVEVEVASRRELPWASGVLRRPVEVSGTTRSERTLDPVMRRAVPQSGTLRATHEVSVTTRAGREAGSTSRRRHDVAPARR